MPRFNDRGSGFNREIFSDVEPDGYYIIIYQQPDAHGGQWSWQIDRGSEAIDQKWVGSEQAATLVSQNELDKLRR